MVISLETLKVLRQTSGYTYQDMANILKISKAFYWQIENKKRTLSYDMALKIAEIFNLKPDDLFYEDQKKSKI